MSETKRDTTAPENVQAPTEGAASGTTETASGESLPPARYRTQERLLMAVLVAAIVVALGFMGWYVRGHANTLIPRALQPWAQKVGVMPMPMAMTLADPVGSPTAKVRAVVIMEHCLMPVQDLLVAICTEYPEQVRAEFITMYGPEGQQILQQHQESCAGVFINDRNRFTISANGGEQNVYLHGMPGSEYTLSQVAAVVKQEIAAAYGSAPADFDQRIKVPESPTPMSHPGGGPQPPASTDDL
jgi:hypothetical protein